MFSNELKILIESIKIVLLGQSNDLLKSLLERPNLDWNRFNKLLSFHKISMIVLEAFSTVNFEGSIMEKLKKSRMGYVVRDLNDKVLLNEIQNLLLSNNITSLPYKGLLFKEKLYNNQNLRERRDIDILVKPQDALAALQILLHDGYEIKNYPHCDIESLQFIIKYNASPELSLAKNTKETVARFGSSIDFHWGIQEFSYYNVNYLSIFESANNLEPDARSIFKMLLNHHGGREFWVCLKHLADLIMYLKTYPEISIQELSEIAKEMKMEKLFFCGLATINNNFEYPIEGFSTSDVGLIEIHNFWEKSNHWAKLKPKINLLKLKKKLLDIPITWVTFLKHEYWLQCGYDFRVPKNIWQKGQLYYVNFFIKTYYWAKIRFLTSKE